MRKATILVGIALLVVSTVAAAVEKTDTASRIWVTLNRAYRSRQNVVLEKYARSSIKSTSLYAKTLLDLSERRFSSLPQDGRACYKAKPGNGTDAAVYFGCIFAVSTGLGLAHQTRASYIWRAKVIAYYKRHSRIIDEATRSDDPADIKALADPDVAVIEKWPKQTVSVKKRWSGIKLRKGVVTAYIDDKPVRMLIDTGDTGITVSKGVIKRLGLTPALIPLGVRMRTWDNTNGYVAHLYYVKNFRVGPITISNAYVTDGPNSQTGVPGSAIGINVLSALQRFSISASKISPFRGTSVPRGACGRMMFTRLGVTRAFEYPFFEVPTSVGRLGMMLDSGMHDFVEFRHVGINLAPTAKSEFTDSGLVEPIKKNVTNTLRQNGKTVRSQVNVFPISVAGIQTQRIFQMGNSMDPLLAGVMTFNFLRKAKVAYDFPDRKMCVIPNNQPTLDASDQS